MVEHYVKAWRKARNLTQAQLAEAIGLTEISMNRIENGKQSLTQDNLSKISQTLGCDGGDLYFEPPEGTRSLKGDELGQITPICVKGVSKNQNGQDAQNPTPPKQIDRFDLSLYASRCDGLGGMVVSWDPVAWVSRPGPLIGVENGFGIYVFGDSMDPIYQQGDIIFAHPDRPANTGNDVLVLLKSRTSEHRCLLRTLLAFKDKSFRLARYNLQEETLVPVADIHAISPIVCRYNRA